MVLVDGRVYKVRERIHRGMLIRDLLAIFHLHALELQSAIRTEYGF